MAMDEIKRAVAPRVERLPPDRLEVDSRAVDRFEEAGLLDELERLAGHDIAGAAQVEHERVVAGVRADVEHALAAEILRNVLTEARPPKVVAPDASDDHAPA